jgi:hypothetical protein
VKNVESLCAAGDRVFKVWRALLHPDQRHSEPEPAALADRLRQLRQGRGHWAIILSRGGHFAAAVFDVQPRARTGQGKHEAQPYKVLLHKTFHRYVVR